MPVGTVWASTARQIQAVRTPGTSSRTFASIAAGLPVYPPPPRAANTASRERSGSLNWIR